MDVVIIFAKCIKVEERAITITWVALMNEGDKFAGTGCQAGVSLQQIQNVAR